MDEDPELTPAVRALYEDPDLSPEARALRDYEPDRPAVRALLARDFHGDLSEPVVAGIHERATEIYADQGEWSGTNRTFERLTGYRGQAWVEEFVGRRKGMTRSDLVLLVAAMRAEADPSLPQPNLYCPDAFVGTWEQLEPDISAGKRIVWHLAADGRFRADLIGDFQQTRSDVTGLSYWCIDRGVGRTSVNLNLRREPWRTGGWTLFGIEQPTASEFTGEYMGYLSRDLFRMRRVEQTDEKSR